MTTLDDIQQAAEGARQGAPVHVRHRLAVADLASGHGRKPVEIVNWIQGASVDAGMVAGRVTLNDFAQALANAEFVVPATVLAMVKALRAAEAMRDWYRKQMVGDEEVTGPASRFDAAMTELEQVKP